ncbi:hypothetical protein [Anaerosinus massiliensis]|uniref:hypothetical protein n=1 Tax=Massilibacillus massiliensis TaxID=1806837 RepID=UPI000DA63890|nr:hypothetical protein [Massilibacillus massiliensis]
MILKMNRIHKSALSNVPIAAPDPMGIRILKVVDDKSFLRVYDSVLFRQEKEGMDNLYIL